MTQNKTPIPSVEPHAKAQERLEALRAELDAIDQELLVVLRERLDCCARIGMLKKTSDIPMMQPQRIGLVQERAAAFAAKNGLSAVFLRSLYELIINETCRLEQQIIDAAPAAAYEG